MIVLVGFMGAGKTTVGRILAGRLGLPFADSDTEIEQRAGRPVREIFATDGEPAFRSLEREVIADLLGGPSIVLALGGGAVENFETRKLLADATVVYLRVSYAEALQRVGGDDGRPLLASPGLDARYAKRLAIYSEVASLTVDTDDRHPQALCREIISRLPAGAED